MPRRSEQRRTSTVMRAWSSGTPILVRTRTPRACIFSGLTRMSGSFMAALHPASHRSRAGQRGVRGTPEGTPLRLPVRGLRPLHPCLTFVAPRGLVDPYDASGARLIAVRPGDGVLYGGGPRAG